VSRADALVAERKFQAARLQYEQAMAAGFRFDGDLPHARNLALIYLNSTPPDMANAIKWLRAALQLDPLADGLRAELAKVLLRTGDPDGAIENYQVLVESNPQSSDYVIALAGALRQGGKGVASLNLLQATVEKFPKLLAVRIEYARQLNFTKQFGDAKQQFSAVLERDPDSLIAQVGIAKATSFQGDQETAIALYDRILRRHPGLYDAFIGKAFALLWSGQGDQARLLFENGLRRHPDDQEVREALSSLPPTHVDASRAVPQRSRGKAPTTRAPAAASTADAPPSPRNAAAPRPADSGVQPEPLRQPPGTAQTFVPLAGLVGAVIGCLLVGAIVHAIWRARLLKRVPSPGFVEPTDGQMAEGSGNPPQEDDVQRNTTQVLVPALAIETVRPAAASEMTRAADKARMRPQVLLVGGPENLADLERRWLAFVGAETQWEKSWSAATARLRNAPPDFTVLNAMTDDGWTSLRMFNWIAVNQAPLRKRSLVIVGTREFAEHAQCDVEAHYLFEPFGASQWEEAVQSMLRLCPPVQPQSNRLLESVSFTNGDSHLQPGRAKALI
jgi:tetratricopeptide (TPR) repeat protein